MKRISNLSPKAQIAIIAALSVLTICCLLLTIITITNITQPTTSTVTVTPTVMLTPIITLSPTITPTTTPSPTLTNTSPSVSFTLIHLTSPIARGDQASASIQTVPGVVCILEYHTPSNNVSGAQGLGDTIADHQGICSWSWLIGINTTPGEGEVIIRVADSPVQYFPIIITE